MHHIQWHKFCYTNYMTHLDQKQIIVFVGLSGSGKSLATQALADAGLPKISTTDPTEAIKELERLLGAGQRTVVIDGLNDLLTLRYLQRTYPKDVHTIAVMTERKLRKRREPNMPSDEIDQRDWDHVENYSLGAIIALADHFVTNNGTREEFLLKIHELVDSF